MRKLPNTLAAKEYVPNTLGNVILLTTSLFSNIFRLIFVYLASTLKTKAKCILFVMTATVFFLISKGCSKIIIKMYLLELSHFCEVFNFFYKFIKYYRCLMMLKSSQCERHSSINSFDVLLYLYSSEALG